MIISVILILYFSMRGRRRDRERVRERGRRREREGENLIFFMTFYMILQRLIIFRENFFLIINYSVKL